MVTGALALSTFAVGCNSMASKAPQETGTTFDSSDLAPAPQIQDTAELKNSQDQNKNQDSTQLPVMSAKLNKILKKIAPYTASPLDFNLVKKNPELRLMVSDQLNFLNHLPTISDKRIQLGNILQQRDQIFGQLDPIEKNAALRVLVTGFVSEGLKTLTPLSVAPSVAGPNSSPQDLTSNNPLLPTTGTGAVTANSARALLNVGASTTQNSGPIGSTSTPNKLGGFGNNNSGNSGYHGGSRLVQAEDGEGGGGDSSDTGCISCPTGGDGGNTGNAGGNSGGGAEGGSQGGLSQAESKLLFGVENNTFVEALGLLEYNLAQLENTLDSIVGNADDIPIINEGNLLSGINVNPGTLDKQEISVIDGSLSGLNITHVQPSEDANSTHVQATPTSFSKSSLTQTAYLARTGSKGGGGIQAFSEQGVASSEDPNGGAAAASQSSIPVPDTSMVRGGGQRNVPGMDCDGVGCNP